MSEENVEQYIFDVPMTVELSAPELYHNFDDLKQELKEQLKPYRNVTIPDETMVPEYKRIKTNLNKIKKTINEKKKQVKKEYMAEYKEFEDKAKELMNDIDVVALDLGNQIEEFEERERQEKKEEIEAFFNTAMEAYEGLSEFVDFELIFDPRWLNKTYPKKKWEREIEDLTFAFNTAVRKLKEEAMEGYVNLTVTEFLNLYRELSPDDKKNITKIVETIPNQALENISSRAAFDVREETEDTGEVESEYVALSLIVYGDDETDLSEVERRVRDLKEYMDEHNIEYSLEMDDNGRE